MQLNHPPVILFLYSNHRKDVNLINDLKTCLFELWDYLQVTLYKTYNFEVKYVWLNVAELKISDIAVSANKIIWIPLISTSFLDPCHDVYPNKGLEVLKELVKLDQNMNIILPVHLRNIPEYPGWKSLPIGHIEEIPNKDIFAQNGYKKDKLLNQISEEILRSIKDYTNYIALLNFYFRMIEETDIIKSTESDFKLKVEKIAFQATKLDINQDRLEEVKKIVISCYQGKQRNARLKLEESQRREKFFRKMFPYTLTLTLGTITIVMLILRLLPPESEKLEPSYDTNPTTLISPQP